MTVCKWVKKFKSGVHDLEDACRKGRTKTSLTSKNIDTVKDFVTEISEGTVHTILTSI